MLSYTTSPTYYPFPPHATLWSLFISLAQSVEHSTPKNSEPRYAGWEGWQYGGLCRFWDCSSSSLPPPPFSFYFPWAHGVACIRRWMNKHLLVFNDSNKAFKRIIILKLALRMSECFLDIDTEWTQKWVGFYVSWISPLKLIYWTLWHSVELFPSSYLM